MSAGYDPFKWADIYTDEEEYIQELIEEEKEREIKNARISEERRNTELTCRN